MKNIILTLSLLILPLFSFSQSETWIGKTKSQIEKVTYPLTYGYTEKGQLYLTYKDEEVTQKWLFNSEGDCFYFRITTHTPGALQHFKNECDKKYYKKSENSWESFGGRYTLIRLTTINNKPTFEFVGKYVSQE